MNFRQRQDQDTSMGHESSTSSEVLEFQSAEEMLRHDAAQIEVPESLSERIADSVRDTTPTPWWKRIFRSGSA